MSEVYFRFELIKYFLLRKCRQYSTGCNLNDVKLTEQMFFVLIVNFPFTDENVQETLLN